MNGLRFLRKFYGWLSVVLFVCLFAVQRFSQPNTTSTLPLFSVFGFTFMGWFSIKWVTEHKNTIAEFSRDNALMVFGPLILGIVDLIFDTPFMQILVLPLQQIAAPLHFNIPQVSNPLAVGGIISLVFLVFFGFYYLLTWIVTVPLFLISVFTVLLPIQFARLLAAIDRKNTFFWFTVFVMVIISAWLSQL